MIALMFVLFHCARLRNISFSLCSIQCSWWTDWIGLDLSMYDIRLHSFVCPVSSMLWLKRDESSLHDVDVYRTQHLVALQERWRNIVERERSSNWKFSVCHQQMEDHIRIRNMMNYLYWFGIFTMSDVILYYCTGRMDWEDWGLHFFIFGFGWWWEHHWFLISFCLTHYGSVWYHHTRRKQKRWFIIGSEEANR